MPAAQPTKAALSNVIGVLVAAGCSPGAVRVNADGSFTVEVASVPSMGTANQDWPRGAAAEPTESDEPPRWEDGK